MLRWVALSALTCVLSVVVGLGKVVPIESGMQSFFLTMAALSATVLISSYDAYETQSSPGDLDD